MAHLSAHLQARCSFLMIPYSITHAVTHASVYFGICDIHAINIIKLTAGIFLDLCLSHKNLFFQIASNCISQNFIQLKPVVWVHLFYTVPTLLLNSYSWSLLPDNKFRNCELKKYNENINVNANVDCKYVYGRV